jgi:hypothetical protein
MCFPDSGANDDLSAHFYTIILTFNAAIAAPKYCTDINLTDASALKANGAALTQPHKPSFRTADGSALARAFVAPVR